MIKGTTSTGFEFEYDEKLLKDWKYISDYAAMMEALQILQEDESNITAITSAVNAMNSILYFLIGKEETNKLQKHLRKVNGGIAETAVMMRELKEIVNAKSKN